MHPFNAPSRARRRRLLAGACIAVAVSAAALPHAFAGDDKPDPGTPVPTALVAAGHIFSTTSTGGTTIAVSANGTLTDFTSPVGFSHFTSPREGYMLCGATNTAFDFGNPGSAGFGASTTSFANGAFTVVRKTTDGALQLTQEFTFKAAARRLAIKMTVKNLSTTTRTVSIRRQADFDVDSAGAQGFALNRNDWGRTVDSVVAWDDLDQTPGALAHGMLLGHESTTSSFHSTRVTTASFDTTGCGNVQDIASPVVSPTDLGAALIYGLPNLAPGQTQSVTVAYQRI